MGKEKSSKNISKTPDTSQNENEENKLIEAPQSFIAYAEYSKTLRTWLVTYGIGGPILFISQEKIAIRLAASPYKSLIIYLFLIGVAAQISISLMNKWINWFAYNMDLNPPMSPNKVQAIVIWLANQFWIDMLSDIVSVIAFVVATALILQIMLT
jgi:hypothetical protein